MSSLDSITLSLMLVKDALALLQLIIEEGKVTNNWILSILLHVK